MENLSDLATTNDPKLRYFIRDRISKKNMKPAIKFNDIPNKMPYSEKDIDLHSIHLGQRKLLLSEMEFLTTYKINSGLIVYAGAAPGDHILFLMTLFPDLKWLLVDPNPFCKKMRYFNKISDQVVDKYGTVLLRSEFIKSLEKSRITLLQSLMSSDIAEVLKEFSGDKYFISDIRTTLFSEEYSVLRQNGTENCRGKTSNLDILWNSAQQFVWINKMHPKKSLVKFRVPYFDKKNYALGLSLLKKLEPSGVVMQYFDQARKLKIDFIQDYNSKKFTFLSGELYLQCFAGVMSGETRLVVDLADRNKFKVYDHADYEGRLCYFNRVERSFVHHKNIFASPKLGFDHCNDCAKEAYIWQLYLLSTGENVNQKNVHEMVMRLSKETNTKFLLGNHGRLFRYIKKNDYWS